MFKKNEYVVYRGEICKVIDIRFNELQKKNYYLLNPIDDDSLRIDVPVDTKNIYLRKLISKEKIEDIINNVPNVECININDKLLENEYRKLLSTFEHNDLIKIIKTTYLKNEKRINNKKKVSERDNDYFDKAEKRLYNEFSVVLNMSFDDTRKYFIERVEKII